ncbi:MAG: D-alanine-D-alanine ligase, partial [Parcubacteria group bacterium GW2011_GWA1_48_11b]
MKKLRIAVITGGPFAEHEGSVLSGGAVEAALRRTGHEVRTVLVKRNGDWSLPPTELKEAADIVFIAMHGKYGEDGTVQDILGQEDIPYAGSSPLTSALAINKVLTGRLFRGLGFDTPRFTALEKHESGHFRLDFDFPVIVKPVNRGLSLGVGVAREPQELNDHLHRAFEFSKSVLVEEYIAGRELMEKMGMPAQDIIMAPLLIGTDGVKKMSIYSQSFS